MDARDSIGKNIFNCEFMFTRESRVRAFQLSVLRHLHTSHTHIRERERFDFYFILLLLIAIFANAKCVRAAHPRYPRFDSSSSVVSQSEPISVIITIFVLFALKFETCFPFAMETYECAGEVDEGWEAAQVCVARIKQTPNGKLQRRADPVE